MSFTRQTWRHVSSPAHLHGQTAIGVAIRRRHLDVVVGDKAATIQTQVNLPNSLHADSTACIPHVLQTIRALLDEQNIAAASLCGIGIGIGLPSARASVHMPADETCPWAGAGLSASLRDEFGVPAYLDTHTNMGTLGEYRYGIDHAVRDMLYVAVDATVTAGIMMNGHLYRGSAGAIGHMAIDPRGTQCHCGQRGCLETSAGAAAIIATAQSQGSAANTLAQVIAAATHGDAGCLAALERAGVALGTALANASVMLNPALIVLGGASMAAGDLLLAPIRQTMMRHHHIARIQIVPSTLGSRAAALGGMAAVLDGFAALS